MDPSLLGIPKVKKNLPRCSHTAVDKPLSLKPMPKKEYVAGSNFPLDIIDNVQVNHASFWNFLSASGLIFILKCILGNINLYLIKNCLEFEL